MREIAQAEGVTVRRIQQIVAKELSRRDANPAEDFALLQIARLERAVELLGAQIDEGKAAVVPAFLKAMEHLNALARHKLDLNPEPIRRKNELESLAVRFGRLDAAREILADRAAARAAARSEKEAKKNAPPVLENTQNREMADFAGQ